MVDPCLLEGIEDGAPTVDDRESPRAWNRSLRRPFQGAQSPPVDRGEVAEIEDHRPTRMGDAQELTFKHEDAGAIELADQEDAIDPVASASAHGESGLVNCRGFLH